MKLKQIYEKETQNLKLALKEAETKLESFKREFSSFNNKNKKDNDDLAFKEEFIRKMQEGIKDKSKAIFELRQSNEQYIKFLEEKDGKILTLEKDLKKEKENCKFYADRLNEMMIEKINVGKIVERERGKSLVSSKKNTGIRSNQSFEPEVVNGKILSRAESNERRSASFNENDSRIQGLQQENLILKKEIKDLNDKYKATEEEIKSFKSLKNNKNFKKDATPRSRRSESSPFGSTKDQTSNLQSRYSESIREKEMLNKCLLEKSSECDSLRKKSSEYEEMIKSMHQKIERIIEEKEELLEERRIFLKKSRNEQEIMTELSNIQESIIYGLKLLELRPKMPKKSLTEDLDQVWCKIIKILNDFRENSENIEKLDEENQFLNDENQEMKNRIEDMANVYREKDKMALEILELKGKNEVLNDYEGKLKVIKENVKNLKLFVGLRFEERGFRKIDDDLADVLVEVQKIIESGREVADEVQKGVKENEKFRKKVKELEGKVKEVEDKNEKLSFKINSLIQENETIEELLIQETQKLEESKESTIILIQENQDLQAYKQKLETLSKELEKNSFSQISQESMKKIQEDLKSYQLNCEISHIPKEKLQESQKEIESLKQKLNLSEKEKIKFEDLCEQIITEKDSEIFQLNELKDKYNKLNEELQNENQEFKERLLENENLMENYLELQKENQKLEQKLLETQDLLENYEILKASNEKLVNDLEDLNLENKGLTDRLKSLTKINEDMSEKQDSYIKTEETLKYLQEQHSKLLESSNQSSQALLSLKSENSHLIKTNEELALTISKLPDPQELYNQIHELQQENSSLKSQISSLSQKLSHKRLLSSQISQLTEENQNLSQKIDSLLEHSSELQQEKAEMTEKLQEMQNKIEKKENKIEKFRVGSRSLERKLSRTESKTKQVISKLDQEKQELLEKVKLEFHEEIEALNEKIGKLNAENLEAEEENVRKEEEITNLMEELSSNRKELKKFIKENVKLEDRIEEMREEIRRSVAEVRNSPELVKELSGESGDREEKQEKEEEEEIVDLRIEFEEKVKIVIEVTDVKHCSREVELNGIVCRLEEQVRDLEKQIRVLEENAVNERGGEHEGKEMELVQLDIKFSTNLEIHEENIRLKREIESLIHKNDDIEHLDLIIEYKTTENIEKLNLAKEKLDHKKLKIESLKNQVKDLLAQSNIKTQLTDEDLNLLKKEIENKNSQIERLTKEITEWKIKYNKLAYSESSPSSDSEDE